MSDLFKQAYSAEEFRKQGQAVIELLAGYLEEMETSAKEENQVIPWKGPEDQLKYWQQDFAQRPQSNPLALFKEAMARSVKVHHPRYLGHQTMPTLPISALSSAVTALLNQGMGVYEMGMVGNTLEKILTEHLAKVLGFGTEASGFITSGGSLGNLTALLAARAITTNIWSKGYQNQPQPAVLISEEMHYCIDRSVRMMGFGSEGIVKVPVNECFQLRTDLLEEYYQQAKADGKQVIAVIGCAGTTSTGSYDDLEAIAAFCQQHQLWFHVDGAHGAPAAFSPHYKHLLKGIEQADSVVVDFHKMMLTPSLSTTVIFKQGGNAYRTFSQRAQYLWSEQESEEWYNGGKRSFECTKAMTSLNVYTIFKTFGDRIFTENVEALYKLASTFAAQIRSNSHFELAYEPESNIVCFRYKATENSSRFNAAIRQQLLEEGRFYIVQTILHGELYLRISLMNPLASEKELEDLLREIEQKATDLEKKGI